MDSAALRFNSSGVATLATVQHPLGKPHVLHYVHFFEDGAWKGYGGQAKRTGALFPQSFDLEVRGNEVFLLYTTHPGDTSTHAPSVPDSLQRSFGSDIAIDSEGELFLAWTENVGEPATPDKVLLVKRFDDGAWTQVGDTLFSLSQPRLAFASDDTLVLAGIREGKAEVRMLTTTWVQLGKPLTTNDAKSDVRSPRLALTPGDTPVLAFRESIDKMPVVSVNGLVKEWVLLGELIEPTSGYEDVKYPRIASDGSSLWVTWIEAEKFSNVGGFIRAARLE